MTNRCDKCGCELITGHIQGGHLSVFSPVEDEKKFRPRHSVIICDACPQCGAVSNIRLRDPEKIR